MPNKLRIITTLRISDVLSQSCTRPQSLLHSVIRLSRLVTQQHWSLAAWSYPLHSPQFLYVSISCLRSISPPILRRTHQLLTSVRLCDLCLHLSYCTASPASALYHVKFHAAEYYIPSFPCEFYPRDAMLARVFATATCLSVSLSVCLSVTRRYCVKTKKDSGMISSPPGSPKTLV